MMPAARLNYATLITPDIERQIEYYTQVLGLNVVSQERSNVFLATHAGEVCVQLQSGGHAGIAGTAFEAVTGVDLTERLKIFTEAGVHVECRDDPAPGVRRSYCFRDPSGTMIQISSELESRPAISGQTGIISPVKIGHIACNAPDIMPIVDFYQQFLGFRISDWRGDFFAFMRCNRDHHTINFVRGEKTKMHHIAFELRDWNEITRACDFLGMQKINLIWGPGRHGPGHNIFTYHYNPDGQIVELFTDLDQMNEDLGCFDRRPWHEDNPQRPKTWEASLRSSNLWGILPPAGFLS